ncbi:hypothetical protein C0J52_06318 [Blattella germanica]|nr:hypothetical protein C0J52_06318 [Blattella germanica]
MLLRRLFSVSARHAAVKSPLPDVVLPKLSLPDYIWENLHRWQDKVAIECGVTGRHYKYGELRKLCRKFAGSLRRAGLQTGSTLSIVMPNSPEWPIVLLGAIEAGLTVTTANPGYTAGFVTVSSLYPTIQKALSKTDQKTKPLVVIAPECESDSSIPRDTIRLQDMLEKECDSSDFSFSGSVHDTVLLPYSSGTTGLPKGVMLSHWNLVSNCFQMNENPEICITEPATGYGMTELGPVVSLTKKGCKKYESAGIPIPNTEMKITDVETGEDLPVGKVGEVCARGPQVMKGNFNNVEATKRTIRDGGWLHTGDLELEEVLRDHPDVLDAAVIGIPNDKYGEVPKAFIVPKRSGVKDEDIKKYVAEKLSAHKHLKGGIEFLDVIPKAPSGKILLLMRRLEENKSKPNIKEGELLVLITMICYYINTRMLLRRMFSMSTRLAAVKSPFPDVALPTMSIPDYIWENVHQWPDKVAVECGMTGRSYKYGQMRNLCRKFASSLRRAGLQPGNTLSIIMPNTAEWPIVFLGAIEAGLLVTTANPAYTADCETHAFVTLSNLYPVIKKAHSLSGRQSKPLVMIAPGFEPATSLPQEIVKLEDMIENNYDNLDLTFSGSIHDTVVQPYSSGTTGLPKGVMLSSYQDIMPVVLPFFHIYGMCVVMLCKLAHGVKLITLPKFEPTSFCNTLEKHQVTGLYVAPPLVIFLATYPELKPKHLQSLRYLICGAAPLGRLDVERFLEKGPGVTFLQASPGVTHVRKQCKKYESVGTPIPNTEVKTVDLETGKELPAGKVGEVCAKGPQVMKGYYNRPESTKEILQDDWLHTGDLGYYDEDGDFFIVDRLKELIKVKGFQVAPAELEELLRSHPDVLDAAVIGVPDDRAGEVPKAYIVPKRSGILAKDIQMFVEGKVSNHKHLKGGIELIDTIPKTPSGKILRRKLKEFNN